MEAMACGVPVVASGISGIPELVDDETTGLLVPPRDPQALAGALLRALGDRGLRASLGARARECSRRYDVQACVRQMEALYDEVLAEVAA
jgi:glycosyltransferase involved in cell wall biosynthesis